MIASLVKCRPKEKKVFAKLGCEWLLARLSIAPPESFLVFDASR